MPDLAIQVKNVLNDRFFEKPFYAEDLKLKAEEILRDQLKNPGGFKHTELI